MGLDCTFEDNAGIPSVWQQFVRREGEIENADLGAGYGLCCNADEAGRFRYVAAVGVRGTGDVPDGMEAVDVPAQRYAVFTHSGHISDIKKTVYTVWNKALPDAGLTPARSPDFELYDKRFDPETGRGIVEIWIPVEE